MPTAARFCFPRGSHVDYMASPHQVVHCNPDGGIVLRAAATGMEIVLDADQILKAIDPKGPDASTAMMQFFLQARG